MNFYNSTNKPYNAFDSNDDADQIPMEVEEPCLPQFASDPNWERAQSPEMC